jgi:hypothetical protein
MWGKRHCRYTTLDGTPPLEPRPASLLLPASDLFLSQVRLLPLSTEASRREILVSQHPHCPGPIARGVPSGDRLPWEIILSS